MGLMVKLTIVGLRVAMGTTIPVTTLTVKVDKCNTLLTVLGTATLLRCWGVYGLTSIHSV
jgi:hypothetical protein